MLQWALSSANTIARNGLEWVGWKDLVCMCHNHKLYATSMLYDNAIFYFQLQQACADSSHHHTTCPVEGSSLRNSRQ